MTATTIIVIITVISITRALITRLNNNSIAYIYMHNSVSIIKIFTIFPIIFRAYFLLSFPRRKIVSKLFKGWIKLREIYSIPFEGGDCSSSLILALRFYPCEWTREKKRKEKKLRNIDAHVSVRERAAQKYLLAR